MLSTAIECAHAAGKLLLDHFGKVHQIHIKDSRSSIVTEADLAADELVRGMLAARHPGHNQLTEEHGFINRGSRFTWIVDPLDGTSNFAAGIPWFGVMIALLEETTPIVAVMYLPTEDLTYSATQGGGARKQDQLVNLTPEQDFSSVLCAFGLDACTSLHHTNRQALALARVAQTARNVRATNSLVDFALTIDGRFGGCVNFHTMLWDIAAPLLIFEEAGARFTDLTGLPLRLSLAADACAQAYAVVGGYPALHAQLVACLAEPLT